jgi:hypothetical protein
MFAHFQLNPDFDATPDGQKFVMFAPEGVEARRVRSQVVLVFNWFQELRHAFQ